MQSNAEHYLRNESLVDGSNKGVINLIPEPIYEYKLSLLNKGLNYEVAPKQLPTEEIIVAVEDAVKGLPHKITDQNRHNFGATLKRLRSARYKRREKRYTK